MTSMFKYTESLREFLGGQVSTSVSVANWIGTLSDAELTEFGEMIKTATRNKPREDLARFLVTAMPRQAVDGNEIAPTKKCLERFLGSTYSTVVMERKERLLKSGKHIHKPNGKSSCSCCS